GMKDPRAPRPARTSTSSTAMAGSRPIRCPTCRRTGPTTSASKREGASGVRPKSSVQATQATLEVRPPLGVRYSREHQQPQCVAHDPARRARVARLVLEQLRQLDRSRIRIRLRLPALLQHRSRFSLLALASELASQPQADGAARYQAPRVPTF